MNRNRLCVYAFFILILSLGTSYGDVANILVNPGFETSSTGNWRARGCTYARATTPTPHNGARFGRASGRTETWQGIEQDVLNKMNIGQTYAVSGWVRTDNATSNDVHLTFQKTVDGATSYQWAASGTANNSGWTYISGSYTLTANGNLTQLLIYVEGPPSGVELHLDDVNIFGETYVPPSVSTDANGNVNLNVQHQVLDGFGGSGAWYEGTVITLGNSNPNIYNILFRDLGLDIYRVRNTYNIDNGYITRSAQI
ncbi:MAG: hypothetical protein EHJ95_08510, partial [Methanobacteriota archaeon]